MDGCGTGCIAPPFRERSAKSWPSLAHRFPPSCRPGNSPRRLVLRLVVLERFGEILRHPLAIDERPAFVAARSANEDVRPDRRPIPRVLVVVLLAQQRIDQPFALVVLMVAEIRSQLFDRR